MILIFFFLLIGTTFGSTFRSADQVWDLPTPPLALGLQEFEINGTLIIPTPNHACSPLSKNFTGFIALVDSDKCPPFTKAENCLNAGAIAVIIRGYRDTFGLLPFYRSSGQKNLSIPVVELWGGLKPTENPEGTENVTIIPSPSPIAEFGEGPWTFYTIFFSLYILITLGLTGYKFYTYYKSEFSMFSLPNLTLGLIIFMCILRIPILIDPTGMRGIYNWGTVEAFLTLDFSFAIVAALVVAFHWDAAMRKIKLGRGNESDKRLKIGGFIVSMLLLIIEITTSVLRGLYLPAMPFLLGKVILYFITSFSVAIYFIWSGRKVLKSLEDVHEKIPKSFKKKAYYGFGAAVCLMFFPITAFLVATPMYDPAPGYFMLRFLASFWLNTATIFLVFIFETRKINSGEKSEWVNTAEQKMTTELGEESEEESDT